MSSFIYQKLAFSNIKKNGKTYFPFILTSICTIMMFYIMCFIASNEGLAKMKGGASLKSILFLAAIIIGIFSTIFLFYTNSFLIKRRKKEIGLYNILGMEKKHIAKVLFWETTFTAFFSIIIGLICGIILSKLMFLALLKLLHFSVTLNAYISISSLITTAIVFLVIFILILINNFCQIHLSNPIDLLKGEQTGEKEPKTKWFLTLIGLISLSAGYYIAITTEEPLKALALFFIAVILVMIGTYSLFTAGSIALLKSLRKNKKYYYKTSHFISVSGLIYRMKQNAVGLANICILSCAVLVVLSTTVSLYIGVDDILRDYYPKDIVVHVYNTPDSDTEKYNTLVKDTSTNEKINVKDFVSYRYTNIVMEQKNDTFILGERTSKNTYNINLIPLQYYNKYENSSIELQNDEAIICNLNKTNGDMINFQGNQFKIKKQIDHNNQFIAHDDSDDICYIILKDEETINQLVKKIANNNSEAEFTYVCSFNSNDNNEKQIEFMKTLKENIASVNDCHVDGIANIKEEFFSMYGGLFFIGIFLGTLFMIATVLIIYYKQISEGYSDKKRFDIMQKVGMSKAEIRKSIHSQVLMIFFLPLLTSMIHIAFAFPMITKMLKIFNLTNISLFAICTLFTVLIFGIIYLIVYFLTAREYYKIVR